MEERDELGGKKEYELKMGKLPRPLSLFDLFKEGENL